MSKNNIAIYKGIASGSCATPEMMKNNPSMFDKELVNAVKAISTAQSKADKAGYAVAYNLSVLNKKRPNGSFIKRMGFKNVSEYAERFHNISGQTALAYAQTAEMLLKKDDFGIHSPFAHITVDGKIETDFTVSQLMELRNADVETIDGLLALGSYTFKDTTKALRFKTSIVKALTTKPKEGKENPYYNPELTIPEIHDILLNAGALLIDNKGISGIKALEMLNAPETPAEAETTAEAETPAEAETTADINPVFDTSDGAIYAAIMNAVKPFIDYADENADVTLMESIKTQLSSILESIQ